MSVFDDLKCMKEKYKDKSPSFGLAPLTKEQYEFLMNDKRTVEERLKDILEILGVNKKGLK